MQLPDLYRQMARVRAFETAVADLWHRGLISGEMHLGTGEEAVAAGVITHMREGDALALTHRCTPALVVRGVPLVPLLREFLGRPDGLCKGAGGHMHVFSREHLAATSGIVGASVPLGAGFALAAKRLRKGTVAVALTGDGAMNQGMLLESLNLAAAWTLPLALVIIDNGWAITTRAGTVTAGDLGERAAAFGWTLERVDGIDVEAVHAAAGRVIEHCRRGKGPAVLHARCPRIDGHYLGDPLLEQSRHLTGDEAASTLGRVVSAALKAEGGGPLARASSMFKMVGTMARVRMTAQRGDKHDPMHGVEQAMKKDPEAKRRIDEEVAREIQAVVEAVVDGEVDHG